MLEKLIAEIKDFLKRLEEVEIGPRNKFSIKISITVYMTSIIMEKAVLEAESLAKTKDYKVLEELEKELQKIREAIKLKELEKELQKI